MQLVANYQIFGSAEFFAVVLSLMGFKISAEKMLVQWLIF